MGTEERFAGGLEPAAFAAHVELIHALLARRADIVERIAELLNAQRRVQPYLQDATLLATLFADCFFAATASAFDRARLEHELDEAHWRAGFKPRPTPGQHNDLIDPAQIASRGFLMWQRTRWPGRHDRVRCAHTLFDLYVLRRLMLLAMRIWDLGGDATARLEQVQRALDELWRSAPAGQVVFLRDARWLFALAQSPTTDELHGYFEVAERIATTLPAADRLDICKASVRMAGGHLRSQLKHVSTQQRVPLDDPSLIASTRKSNALDLATLVQALVPVLASYDAAVQHGDAARRYELADAIFQGVSPDPELFVNRIDLLRPYSMIEHLFVATDAAGTIGYTAMAHRHLRLLDEYETLLGRVRQALAADVARFRPVEGSYSPYGLLYGFSSRILEHMALKAFTRDADARFTLEDAFTAGGADKLAWVSGWRKLPHVPRDVTKLFEYPQQFAAEVFARVERAFGESPRRDANGRLLIADAEPATATPKERSIAELPIDYVLSSDPHVAAAGLATACDEARLLHGRVEGELLVSYRTEHGWVGISKDVLTDIVGAGRDVRARGLPSPAARALALLCRELIAAQ